MKRPENTISRLIQETYQRHPRASKRLSQTRRRSAPQDTDSQMQDARWLAVGRSRHYSARLLDREFPFALASYGGHRSATRVLVRATRCRQRSAGAECANAYGNTMRTVVESPRSHTMHSGEDKSRQDGQEPSRHSTRLKVPRGVFKQLAHAPRVRPQSSLPTPQPTKSGHHQIE